MSVYDPEYCGGVTYPGILTMTQVVERIGSRYKVLEVRHVKSGESNTTVVSFKSANIRLGVD